jgi:hypothetical protein
MVTALTTRHRRKVSKRSDAQTVPEIIMSKAKNNKSMPPGATEAPTPKISAPAFDAKRLETFSLGDFVELLEAAGMMPTGSEKVLSAEEIAAGPIEMDFACVGRLGGSQFRFLVEHLRPDDPTSGRLDQFALAGLLSFLYAARSLFYHLLNLKRREARVGRTNVPTADPAQNLFASFTMSVPATWSVTLNGKLIPQPFPERDPTWRLVQRLLKELDGADPARVRRCAFEGCGRVFYAKRKDSICCSARCNNNRLQREWYQSNKLEAKAKIAGRANRREELKARKRNKP